MLSITCISGPISNAFEGVPYYYDRMERFDVAQIQGVQLFQLKICYQRRFEMLTFQTLDILHNIEQKDETFRVDDMMHYSCTRSATSPSNMPRLVLTFHERIFSPTHESTYSVLEARTQRT